jgi:hypothetical protein
MSHAPPLRIPALEALKRVVLGMGGTHELVIELRDASLVAKAEWLRAQGRDLYSVSTSQVAHMLSAMRRATPAVVASGNPTVAYDAVKAAAKEVILWRFVRQGWDRTLRPLSPKYAARKRANPALDERIGIAYGALYRATVLANVSMRKVA